jgi:hypothetical protein
VQHERQPLGRREGVEHHLQRQTDRRPILPMRQPGKAARAIRPRTRRPTRAVGRRTREDFLASWAHGHIADRIKIDKARPLRFRS